MKHRPSSAESRARGLGGRVGGGHEVPDARDCFRKRVSIRRYWVATLSYCMTSSQAFEIFDTPGLWFEFNRAMLITKSLFTPAFRTRPLRHLLRLLCSLVAV